MNLYSTHAEEFSKTRQSPWKGWEKVMKELENEKMKRISALDLGCGNGRFLKYLQDQKTDIKRYLGVDNSDILLNIAKKEFTQEFKKVDLNAMDWEKHIEDQFNLVVSFGVMHHIESFQLRRNLLESATNLLETGGILAIAYWQFLKDPKLKAKAKKIARENDYELPFGQNGATRFCHFVNETEALKLEENLPLTRIDSYYSDGKSGDLNYYVIYKKD